MSGFGTYQLIVYGMTMYVNICMCQKHFFLVLCIEKTWFRNLSPGQVNIVTQDTPIENNVFNIGHPLYIRCSNSTVGKIGSPYGGVITEVNLKWKRSLEDKDVPLASYSPNSPLRRFKVSRLQV